MPEMAVAIISPDHEGRIVLQMALDATAVASTVCSFGEYPLTGKDSSLRRIQDTHADVVVVDLPPSGWAEGVKAIELLHAEVPHCAVFAVGDMRQPTMIVSAMRAGAKEFLERPVSTSAMLDALARLASVRRKKAISQERGKAYAFVNAKGGSGASTIAVNTAISLAAQNGRTVLLDLAPLGHTALHFNVRPQFTVVDALQNVQRMDYSLLEGFITRTEKGVHLLAGVDDPMSLHASTAELAQLVDLLLMHYRAVVVDLSSRLDAITRTVCDLSDNVLIICQSDVTSLWSANRVQNFLGQANQGRKVQLVLNRFKKIPGFSESDAEAVTQLKVMAKIPNEFQLVANAIEQGIPVAQQNHSQIARTFGSLASLLATGTELKEPRPFSLFGR